MGVELDIATDWGRYRVVEDIRLPYRVLAWGRALDEVSGNGLPVPLNASTTLRLAKVKMFADGLWCVAGEAGKSFSDLTVANAFTVELAAHDYRKVTVNVTVPANPVFPVGAGVTAMRHLPVRLQGRVVNDVSGAAVPNARIITMDPPTGPPPAERVLLLRAPLKRDHNLTATVRGVTLNAAALPPPARELAEEARLGSTVIVINNRQGLASGQIIRFGAETTGEFARIDTVSPLPANPALPGEVVLETPMGRSFARRTSLNFFTAGGAVGPARMPIRLAEAGEGTLFVNNLPSGVTVQVTQAGLPTEFHAPGGLTDADGYYAIDALNRFDRLYLGAEAGGFPSPPVRHRWVVDYGRRVNLLDMPIRP